MQLPRPYEDELVGSVVARGLVYSGRPVVDFVKALVGRRVSTLSFFMPADLPCYAQACGIPTDVLLSEHTFFPYVTSYLPRRQMEELQARLLAGSVGSGSLASLVQSGTGGMKALRFCPACSDTEVNRYGESYWHRSHNLPAVKVCHQHGCALNEVHVPSVDRAHLLPLPMHHRGGEPKPRASHGALFEVAVRSARLLKKRQEVDACSLPAYRARALDVGYELPSGHAAGWQMAQDLRKYFGNELLDEAGCSYPTQSKHHWPARMVRPGARVTFAPAKHVLLQTFFAANKPGKKAMEYAAPVRQKRDFSGADKELAEGMRARMVAALGAKERISVQALTGNTKHWNAYRLYRDRFPATTEILAEYRASDAAWRQQGGRAFYGTKDCTTTVQ